MADSYGRLPESMLEIMLAVWKIGRPATSAEIGRQLSRTKTWTATSILTFLSRLTDRKFLSCEKRGRRNVYTALVSETEYREREGKALLERLCGNSVREMVACLYGGNIIGPDDLEELMRFILEKKKELESENRFCRTNKPFWRENE